MHTLEEPPKPAPEMPTTIDTRMIGHSLCNSLSVIKNSAYFLDMKVGGEGAKIAKHLNLILQEVSSANRTIMNLMDALESATPSRAPCDANQLIRQALSQIEAPEGVEVQPMLAQQLPVVSVDAKQMIRVIENVLIYQFSGLGPGSTVRVLSRHSQTRVLVDLVDSGSGISREQVAALFQADQSDGSCHLHLGLNAARKLAISNGSRLDIESRPGVGTRYSLAIPVA